jgi:hypothetical protein
MAISLMLGEVHFNALSLGSVKHPSLYGNYKNKKFCAIEQHILDTNAGKQLS